MKTKFIALENGHCGLSVIGLELEDGQYADSNLQLDVEYFRYLDTVTVNTLSSVNSDNVDTLYAYEVNEHKCKDYTDFVFNKDGLYEVLHLIIPTKEWVDNISIDAFLGITVYYYCGDGCFKSRLLTNNGDLIEDEISIKELIEAPVENTTIFKGSVGTFCLCHLTECFHEMCRDLLSSFCGKCVNKLNIDKEAISNRDLIWMAINAIKYALELNQVFEALRILESLNLCGNICSKFNRVSNGSNCGCIGQA